MSTISVFIRARNEAKALARTLPEVKAQDRQPDEIVILDNESEDETHQVGSACDAIVHTITRAEFTYGGALNRSVELTHGDIIVFLSAHSPPVERSWLRQLVGPIEEDKAQACFGRQVPEPGVNHLEEWITYRTFPKHPSAVKALLGLQRIQFSNANAAISASLLRNHPFREDLTFAEDQEWAKRVEAHGATILYRPEAPVFHSHRFSPGDLEKRMQDVGRAMQRQGVGRAYGNSVLCQSVKLATMAVDLIYCITRGYWQTIPQIARYRSEYFSGLRRGLRGTRRLDNL